MDVKEDRGYLTFCEYSIIVRPPDEVPGFLPAQKLWYAILDAQIETGGPFMCYKDHANSTAFFYLREQV
jgi:ribonucleotide reductase alpha subunit